ncbi:hypothetical protein HCH_04695 [Hahella chejuensis KCTC 2396]|uniref:Uncharacterized protein n=1 Tax=Hahella chejuensis (strain KCTC 2396) TaxID=349521 RepID=Q2SD81_HAHCH|nr:hypothetical protein HCH_04695 [Hahella chejuensis KCTC 2396]
MYKAGVLPGFHWRNDQTGTGWFLTYLQKQNLQSL